MGLTCVLNAPEIFAAASAAARIASSTRARSTTTVMVMAAKSSWVRARGCGCRVRGIVQDSGDWWIEAKQIAEAAEEEEVRLGKPGCPDHATRDTVLRQVAAMLWRITQLAFSTLRGFWMTRAAGVAARLPTRTR